MDWLDYETNSFVWFLSGIRHNKQQKIFVNCQILDKNQK